MGGLAISPKSECVYDGSNRVIPGLFAAGELAGGIHGRNRLGGSALLECVDDLLPIIDHTSHALHWHQISTLFDPNLCLPKEY